MAVNNTINTTNPGVDLTVKIFDNFYRYQGSISAQEYDIVLSYFRSVFSTLNQAKNFTTTLFRVSDTSGIPPMDLLAQIQASGNDLPQVTLTFAYYLNTLQSAATMLGVKLPYTPNFYTARNIRQ